MNSFIIMLLGAALAAPPVVVHALFQTNGYMAPNQQLVQQLPTLKAGKEVRVFADSEGNHGDLSCYLLVKGKNGYAVADFDEDPHNKMCYLTYTPDHNVQARVLLRNNGTGSIHFDTTINQ